MKTQFIKYYLLLVLPLVIVITGLKGFASEPLRIVIIPFSINSEKDLSFLQDGISEMLILRLSYEGNIEVVEKKKGEGAFTDENARETGGERGADFVIFGSLTVLGNSVSISAKMLAIKGDNSSIFLFDQSQGIDGVMPKISLFAENAGKKLAEAGYSTKLPQEKNQPEASMVLSEEQPSISPQVVPARAEEKFPLLKEKWRSDNLNILINGIAIGDVDGDGKNETIVITPHTVQLYRYKDSHFSGSEELAKDRYNYYIGVDMADINGNGFSEIFISALNTQHNRFNSYVLEYDGKNFHRIVNGSRWHYRVIKSSEEGNLLFGQKDESKGNDIFSGSVFEMAWKDENYEPVSQVVTSGVVNIMGFSVAGIMGTGADTILSYSRKNRIQVMGRSGEIIFSGDDDFGGGGLYFSIAGPEPGSDIRRFFPTRLCVEDINADGVDEIVSIKNIEATGGIRKNFREFKGSEIQTLSWNGSEILLKGKTPRLQAYISDITIGDWSNDKKNELVAAVIIKSGSLLWKKQVCALVVYALEE